MQSVIVSNSTVRSSIGALNLAPGHVDLPRRSGEAVPDHATNGRSRADVLGELEAARKDGTLALIHRGAPLPIKNSGPAKTRQQVIDAMLSESPEQRRARLELMIGGG